MGWTRLGMFAAMAPAVVWSAPASAAPSPRDTVNGILLQADIARIAERRRADDRELQNIRESEQRILGLRGDVARWRETARRTQRLSRDDRRARDLAERKLNDARSELARLAERLATGDAEWAAEREAYRRELRQTVAQATPEQLVALALFAEGKRTEAWPILEALDRAHARALVVAAGIKAAAVYRGLAEKRALMWYNSEASAADVLALWKEAATYDPDDFATQLEISELALETQELPAARAAAERAVALAEDDNDRIRAFGHLSSALQASSDLTGAVEAERHAALLYLAKVQNRNLSLRDAQRFELRLRVMARLKRELHDLPGAIAALEAASVLDRAVAAQSPRNPDYLKRLVEALRSLALTQSRARDLTGERTTLEEAVTVLRKLMNWESISSQSEVVSIESEPNRQEAAADLGDVLRRLSDNWVRAGDPDRAVPLLVEAVMLLRQVPGADRSELGSALLALARAERKAGHPDRAVEPAREGELVYGDLLVAAPADPERRIDHGLAVSELSSTLEAAGQPGEALVLRKKAVALWQAMVAQLPDGASYQDVLDEARTRRDALQQTQGGQ